MAKRFFQKSLRSPQYGPKWVKRDLQLIKMNFGAETFTPPGTNLALKRPGFLRLEVLQGLRKNYFVFCLNFRQVSQINQKYWPKKVFLNKMGILGAFLAIQVPPGTRTRFQKWVNSEVFGIGTCKFEFSTIKTPITT